MGVRLLGLFVITLTFWPGAAHQAVPAAPEIPLQYSWGATYREVSHDLAPRSSQIVEEREGERIRLTTGSGEIRYLFFTREKIGDIILEEREEEGQRRVALKKLVLEPAHPLDEAPLYAVDLVLAAGLPLDFGSAGASSNPELNAAARQNSTLLQALEENYGKAMERGVAGTLEYADADTLVRVYYQVRQDRRYAMRLSFLSRSISRARNNAINELRRTADRRIRKAIDRGNRELKRRSL